MTAFEIDEAVSIAGLGQYVVILHKGEIAIAKQAYGQYDERQDERARPSLSCLHLSSALSLSSLPDMTLKLGVYNRQPISLLVSGTDFDLDELDLDALQFVAVREFVSAADPDQFALASRASQLNKWRQTHNFCSACGSRTELDRYDRAFICTKCDFRMYPRILPCVIGVIIRDNQILLARNHKHGRNVYSALAGFMEAGETPEEAFAREVKEEVNLEIEQIEYHSAQSWPFPNQLMLGFVARYKAGTIKIDTKELADAAWFDKADLPELPPEFTISAKLIAFAVSVMEKATLEEVNH